MCANYVVFFQWLAMITFSDNPYFDLSNGHMFKWLIKNVIRKKIKLFSCFTSQLQLAGVVWHLRQLFFCSGVCIVKVHTMGELDMWAFRITITDRACGRNPLAACDIQILRLEAVWNHFLLVLISPLQSYPYYCDCTILTYHDNSGQCHIF